jgi:hypothetical protein
MGHQFRVYLSQQDEAELVDVLRGQGGVLLFRPVYYNEDERMVATLSELGRYPTDQQLALTAPEFVAGLLTTTYPQGHNRLDLVNSPVIEYGRSKLKNQQLRPGRFWYQLDSTAGKKPEKFKKWAASVFRLLKKQLVKVESPLESYVGREATEKAAAGEVELTTR